MYLCYREILMKFYVIIFYIFFWGGAVF